MFQSAIERATLKDIQNTVRSLRLAQTMTIMRRSVEEVKQERKQELVAKLYESARWWRNPSVDQSVSVAKHFARELLNMVSLSLNSDCFTSLFVKRQVLKLDPNHLALSDRNQTCFSLVF